ncbi:MAG: pyridoxal-phosphate dependent enzyme, partial [Kiritimatiellae bacterium]|nr:pyridoxal-phosphate dependent enzyme [Kiritimatiellia bacterium]
DYDIEGIGNDFVAETMDMALVDDVVKVSDAEAFAAARDLARREGIVAGSSSGAALAAALRAIRAGLRGNVVVLFPDRGDRYFSKGLFPEA